MEGVVVVCLGGGGVILSVEDVRVDAKEEACWVDIVGEEIGAFILNCGRFLVEPWGGKKDWFGCGTPKKRCSWLI